MITHTKIKSFCLLVTLTFSCTTTLYGIWPFGEGQEDFVGFFQPLLNQERTTLSDVKIKLDQHTVSGELIITKTSLFSPIFSLFAKEFMTLGQYLSSMTGQTIELENLAQDIFYSLPVRSLTEIAETKKPVPEPTISPDPIPQPASSPYQINSSVLAKDKRVCTKMARALALHINKLATPFSGKISKFDVIERLVLCNTQILRLLIELFRLIEEEYALYVQASPDEFKVLDLSSITSQLEYIQNLHGAISYERQMEMQSSMLTQPTQSWLTTLPSAPQLLVVLGAIGAALFFINQQYIAPIKVKMERTEADGKSYTDRKTETLITERSESLRKITSQIETLLGRQEDIEQRLPEVLIGLREHLEEEHYEDRGRSSQRSSIDYSPKSPLARGRRESVNFPDQLSAKIDVIVPKESEKKKKHRSWLPFHKHDEHASWAPDTTKDKSEEVEEDEEEPRRLKKKKKRKKGHSRQNSDPADSRDDLPPSNEDHKPIF